MSAKRFGGGSMRAIELAPEHPIETEVEVGKLAEANGFDIAFASCHYNNRDPFITLDRVAATTDSIRLGPGVANPYEAHPVTLASRVATLAEVSDGRAVFGIGAGDKSVLDGLGIERTKPLKHVREAMAALRDLWEGNRVDHSGTFTANGAHLNYSVPGEIPIYVGAQGPMMLRMAGAHADGVLINASHPDDLDWAIDRVEEGREERTRDDPPTVAAYASVSVAADRQAARRAARPPVAFIVAGGYETVLDRHDIDPEQAERIGALIGTGRYSEAFDAVTERMLDRFCIAGDQDDVTDQLDAVLDQVDGIVAGAPLGPDRQTAITLLGDSFRQLKSG